MANIIVRPATLSEVPTITTLAIEAFGDTGGLRKALFPDPARRDIDFPPWRLATATARFSDPGRHNIVAVERRDDGTEVIAGCAEWIAPGGPDPHTPAEEKGAKNEELRKQWPASLDRDAIADFSKTVDAAATAALKKAGLPENAAEDMWGEYGWPAGWVAGLSPESRARR